MSVNLLIKIGVTCSKFKIKHSQRLKVHVLSQHQARVKAISIDVKMTQSEDDSSGSTYGHLLLD